MGTVYLAKDKELERTVAIKVLHRGVFGLGDEATLLLDEARTVAKLKHPLNCPCAMMLASRRMGSASL